jgi:hypothetical protein
MSAARWEGAAATEHSHSHIPQSIYNDFVKERLLQSTATAAATEHSESSSSAIDALPALEPQAAAPAATGQATATEHGLPQLALSRTICLSVSDIPKLRHAETTRRPKRFLHELARHALDQITSAGVDSTLDKDLDNWFPWKEYIACHNLGHDVIGEGVTHAVAEFIEGTRDGNRGGQQRLDFVVYRCDGSYCRLHPGSKPSLDAKLVTILATEQIPQIPFTYELAKSIPKIDQMGKKDAYRFLLDTPPGRLPVTNDAPFKWWLFACNLGKNTRDVIGPGITAAVLEQKMETCVHLVFTRSDNTTVKLVVTATGTRVV